MINFQDLQNGLCLVTLDSDKFTVNLKEPTPKDKCIIMLMNIIKENKNEIERLNMAVYKDKKSSVQKPRVSQIRKQVVKAEPVVGELNEKKDKRFKKNRE